MLPLEKIQSKQDSPRSSDNIESSRAPYACTSCRKQKKGCDKVLPTCSACIRLKRNCKYATAAVIPPEDYAALLRRLAYLEERHRTGRELSSSPRTIVGLDNSPSKPPGSELSQDGNRFPCSFFLDVDVFQRNQVKGPVPRLVVPDEVLMEVGGVVEIQATVGTYFFSTSTWFGIVSKKKLYQELHSSSSALEADLALLILCMRLINSKISVGVEQIRSKLYLLAKEFYNAVELSGISSLRLLQAGVLIALYETGHAVYPEAYLTIGRVARAGQAIGLQDTAGIPQLALEPKTWDEMEERRRLWWALFILDRHMNIGNPTRSLALADPWRGVWLPVDDKSFEQGEPKPSEPLFVSSSTNIDVSPFPRLCQASNLLSLVLKHINEPIYDLDKSDPDEVSRESAKQIIRAEESKQLARATEALCTFLQPQLSSEATIICVPIAICYSALILLYESFLKAPRGFYPLSYKNDFHHLAVSNLSAVIGYVSAFATHIQRILLSNVDQISTLVASCLYRAAVHSTDPRLNISPSVSLHMKQTLSQLGSRWKVADEYARLLNDA